MIRNHFLLGTSNEQKSNKLSPFQTQKRAGKPANTTSRDTTRDSTYNEGIKRGGGRRSIMTRLPILTSFLSYTRREKNRDGFLYGGPHSGEKYGSIAKSLEYICSRKKFISLSFSVHVCYLSAYSESGPESKHLSGCDSRKAEVKATCWCFSASTQPVSQT